MAPDALLMPACIASAEKMRARDSSLNYLSTYHLLAEIDHATNRIVSKLVRTILIGIRIPMRQTMISIENAKVH
eukprot:6156464-Pleurochrysis_carterae.AAC.1